MNPIKKLISGVGMLCAFGCSSQDDEQERLDQIRWLDHHVQQISTQVAADIEKEKKGFYPHDAKTEYRSKGFIDYELKDKTGKRLVVSERSLLSLNDIRATDGFSELKRVVTELGLQMELKRLTIDGDEVDGYMHLDEYIDDQENYFVLTVSGW